MRRRRPDVEAHSSIQDHPPTQRWLLFICLGIAAMLAVLAISVAAYEHFVTEPRDVRTVACQNTLSLYTAYEFLKFRTSESTVTPPAEKRQAYRAYALLEELVPIGKCDLTRDQVRAEARTIIRRATEGSHS